MLEFLRPLRVLDVDTPTATQLSQVISQVTAPAFLLGAVAAFISLLIARLNRVIDRYRTRTHPPMIEAGNGRANQG
jgi:hypothetical protein